VQAKLSSASLRGRVFFGSECPLIQEGFKPLAGLLQDPEYFHNYTPVNWVALTWKAHLDAQAFFDHKGFRIASHGLGPAYRLGHRLQLQIRSGGPPPGPSRAPPGLPSGRQPPWSIGDPVEPPGRGPPSKHQKPNDRTTVRTPASTQGALMVAWFCPLINQAAAAVPNLRASMLWKTPDVIAKLLGSRFLALVPANKTLACDTTSSDRVQAQIANSCTS
jgi:hypothetical protein